jgi:cyclopropane fatty-acyl-phospholipid synthase-like methyltransferase
MKAAKVNDWNEFQANRQQGMWGKRYTNYICDLYDFAIEGGNSWLDLGCGFGRFLKYLLERRPEADYVGYDSSIHMLNKLKESFPGYSPRVSLRDITQPITFQAESVVCCSVFIHLDQASQSKILDNLASLSVYTKSIAFDIYALQEGDKKDFVERFSKHNFRMTYQSHHVMTEIVRRRFPDFDITTSFFTFSNNQCRVNYKLSRR